MAITIFRSDYDALWQQANPQLQEVGDTGFTEVRQTVPERLGRGYIQRMRWNGIDLALFHYQFHDDVHVIEQAQDVTPIIGEIGFHLSGNRSGKCSGENFIQWGRYDDPDQWIWITYADDPILKIDIHLESSHGLSQLIADTLKDLPAEIRQCLEDCDGNWLSEINTITPAMRSPRFNNPDEQIPYLGKFVTSQPINLGDLPNLPWKAWVDLRVAVATLRKGVMQASTQYQ